MTDVNENQLGVEKAFVKSWEEFEQLDTGHFMFYECELVDSISDNYGIHGRVTAISIDMQNGAMTIYDRAMDVFAKFDVEMSLGQKWDVGYGLTQDEVREDEQI